MPITDRARIQATKIRQHRTKTKNKQQKEKTRKQRKVNQLRLFKLKSDVLKISIDLQTALVADTHLSEGQWLTEQLNAL
jgi:hypothetical protein